MLIMHQADTLLQLVCIFDFFTVNVLLSVVINCDMMLTIRWPQQCPRAIVLAPEPINYLCDVSLDVIVF